jgi:hypothetical protein
LQILEKAGQAKNQVRWPDRFQGMDASGRKTAPLQVSSEVVTVTDSACQFSLEASSVYPIAFVLNQFTPFLGAGWPQLAPTSGANLHSGRYSFPIPHPVRTCGERRLANG